MDNSTESLPLEANRSHDDPPPELRASRSKDSGGQKQVSYHSIFPQIVPEPIQIVSHD